MRKPPETGRKRRAAGRGARVALGMAGAAALAGLYLWAGPDPAPPEVPWRSLVDALSDARQDLIESLQVPSDAASAGASGAESPIVDAPEVGSVAASLLSTSAGDRNQMFWRTIAEAGFGCDEVRTASPLGSAGSAWRAKCGDARIYLIEVGESGRLRVAPIPFNDTLGPTPIRVMPDEQ